MTIQTWPGALPKPQKTISYNPLGGLSGEEEEINPARIRTYPERELNLSMVVTQAQLATFKTWYETDLNGGGSVFTADWLSALGFTFHRLRFIKVYKADFKGGGRWAVGMNLEVIAEVPYSEGKPDIWTPEE
jgi:hypothetical protein